MANLHKPITKTAVVRQWRLMSFSKASNLLHKITFGLIGDRDYVCLIEKNVVIYYPPMDDRSSKSGSMSRADWRGAAGGVGKLGAVPPRHFNCRCN